LVDEAAWIWRVAGIGRQAGFRCFIRCLQVVIPAKAGIQLLPLPLFRAPRTKQSAT